MAQAKKAVTKQAGKAAAPSAVKKAVPVLKAQAAAPAKAATKAAPKTAAKSPAKPAAKPAVAKAAPVKAAPAKAAAVKPAPVKAASGKVASGKAAKPVPAPVAAPPAPVARTVPNAKPVVAPASEREIKAAVDYLLQRSASRSEAPVMVNGKRLLSEEELLRMPEDQYMNEAQLAFFRHRLKEMERELVSNADETTEHLRETVIVPDPADRATIEEEHALELRTRDRERKLLKKVQASIHRIDAGDYGWCEETGEPIGIPRLLARPTATLSLEAQQRRELKQKLYGD